MDGGQNHGLTCRVTRNHGVIVADFATVVKAFRNIV